MIMIHLLVTLFLFTASTSFTGDMVYENLRKEGFFEIENTDLLRPDYTELYREYDKFIELVNSDESFFDALSLSEKEFVAISEYKGRYCAAPPSYRNPDVHLKKVNNRIYFQFIEEHFDLIAQKYPCVLEQARNFFDRLRVVDQVSKKYFAKVLLSLESQYSGISKAFYANNSDLTIVTKIVRYRKTQNWNEKPHFDKSGLTIILDNDDNHQSLMLCKNTVNPTRDTLELPLRKYAKSQNSTSALLIGGLCLQTLDCDIGPTLHYVGPIANEYRHSLISFLLIPGIDTSAMKTEFTEN